MTSGTIAGRQQRAGTAARAVGDAARPARRPALDGLRAIAVLLVVAAHFAPEDRTLWGGTLGVDAFFVLSGYLITGLLLTPGALRPRGLARFWYRRARRLLPALLVLCLLTTVAVWYLAPPTGWPEQRAGVLAALVYTANWHLMASGAWTPDQPFLPPLAHTWSLAVEEQFYLVWPFLLAAALWLGSRTLRGGRRVALGIAVVGVLLSAAWTARASGTAAATTSVVFSTWMRAQQLLAGAVLALLAPAALSWASRRKRSAGLALGGWAVLAAAVAVDVTSSSWYFLGGALLVAAAVAAIILAVEAVPAGPVARVLSAAPLVAVGRISYGVYLFHHPLLVFMPLPRDGSSVVPVEICRLLVTFGLASLSFVLVERPLAAGRLPLAGPSVPRQAGLLAAGAAVTVAVCVGATALPGTWGEQLAVRPPRPCGEPADGWGVCTAAAVPGARSLLLAGQPLSGTLGVPLAAAARSAGLGATAVLTGTCSPAGVVALRPGSGGTSTATVCADLARQRLLSALRDVHPSALVLADADAAVGDVVVDGVRRPPGTPEHDDGVRRSLLAVVDAASAVGARTVLVELPPPSAPLGSVVAGGRPAGQADVDDDVSAALGHYDAVVRDVAAGRPGTVVLPVTDLVCPDGSCPAVVDGVVVRKAGSEFTAAFAGRLGTALAARVVAALDRPTPRPPAG